LAKKRRIDYLLLLRSSHRRYAAQERLFDGLTRWNRFERACLGRVLAGQLPGRVRGTA
jgi:hypothetical protein